MHPTPKELDAINTVRSLMDQLQDLDRNIDRMGAYRWNRSGPERFANAQTMRFFDYSFEDDAITDLTSQIIQVETSAKLALGQAQGSRAYGVIKDSAGHIPTPTGDFKTIKSNIRVLMAPHGPYRTFLRQFNMSGPASAPSGGLPPRSEAPLNAGQRYRYKKKDGTYGEFVAIPD